MENEWAIALSENKKVEVEIKAYFEDGSKRPSRFDVYYWVNGKPSLEEFNN